MLYIGKAKNKLTNRYTQKFINGSGAEALIKKTPDNDTALGVERLILDKFGGGAKSKLNSNINHPTTKMFRIDKGRKFLNKNYPGWESIDNLNDLPTLLKKTKN